MTQKAILLVEDDPHSRELTKELLTYQNYQVLEAADAQTALTLLKTQKPDLILTDAALPGIDGFQLTRQIRNLAEFAEIPIIMVSGYTKSKVGDKAEAAGSTSYISKPVNIHKLLQKIQELLD